MKLLPLFDCQKGPRFRGLSTRRDPSAVSAGEFTIAENLRCEGGALEVRPGVSWINGLAPPVAGGICLGGAILEREGLNTALAAMLDPQTDKVRVFRARFNGAWTPWAEVTGSGPQWGDTRMSAPSEGGVVFLPIAGPDGGGKVLIQSGAGDLPRVYTLQPESLVIAHPVEPPQTAETDAAAAYFPSALDVAGSACTMTLGGGGSEPFAAATLGAAGEGTQLIELKGSATSGVVGEGAWAAAVQSSGPGIDLSRSAQLILVCAVEGEADPWPKLKLEAGRVEGAGMVWQSLHDPAERRLTHTLGDAVFTSPDGLEFRLAGFAVDNAKDLANVTGLRLTAAAPLAPGFRLLVAWVAAGGGIPGSAQFAVSYFCPESGVESGGAVLNSSAFRESGNQDWLSRAAASLDKPIVCRGDALFPGMLARYPTPAGSEPISPVLPVLPSFSYCFSVPVSTPVQAEGEKGVRQAAIYRRDAGETEFTLQAKVDVAQFQGVWQPLSGAGRWQWRMAVQASQLRGEDRDYSTRMPEPGCTAPPAGRAMVQANGRLFAAAPRGSGGDREAGAVWASELDKPLRFKEVATVTGGVWDERSAYVCSCGERPATALLATAEGLGGAASVIAWTDEAMHRLDGLRAERIAGHGALSALGVAEKNGQIMWLDSDMAVMEAPGLRDLSRLKTDSLLKAVPPAERSRAACIHHDNRWLAAFSEQEGGGATRVLVWNKSLALWESCDRLPADLALVQWQPWRWQGERRCLFWTRDGRLAEWGSGATDAGTPIEAVLQSPEFFGPPGGQLRCRRSLVFGEAAGPGKTAVIERVCRGPDAAVAGSAPLAANGLTHAYDSAPTGEPAGAQAEAMKIKLRTQAPSGWSLFCWSIEVEGIDLGAVEA